MIDISKQKIELTCEACNAILNLSLNQVAREETVICRCGQKIKLQDDNRSTKRGIRDVNKAFRDLEKTLKSFGK